MIHKTDIEKYEGSMKKLCEDIGDLQYDSLAELFGLLSDKISNDGLKDRNRNRIKLASCLENTSNLLQEAKKEIDKAWKICEPYM